MRKKEGNKEIDIINAAIEVFANKGFFDSKISDIAELANVSVGSVYVYYESKENILYKIFDDICGSLYKQALIIAADKKLSIEKKHDAIIDTIFDAFTKNTSLAIVIAHEQQRLLLRNPKEFTPFFEKFAAIGDKLTKEGIRTKVFAPDIDPQISRLFLHSAFRELINSWAVNPKKFPLNKIRNNFKILSKFGLLKCRK